MKLQTITIDNVEYNLVPKETKSELDLLKEKYATGDYICVQYTGSVDVPLYKHWHLVVNCTFNNRNKNEPYRLIHKKHKPILDAYLADNSVEIECIPINEDNLDFPIRYPSEGNFIEWYYEGYDYRLKPQTQYPIFKRNKDGDVFKIVNANHHTIMLSEESEILGSTYGTFTEIPYKTIPYYSERDLYHLQPTWAKDKFGNISIIFYENLDVYRNFELTPITPKQLKVMPFIWDMYQKVLKEHYEI